jgi:hypothetical protein
VSDILNTCTGRSIFLSATSPMSSSFTSILPCTSSRTLADMQMLPGSANASRRAAIFTPSP